MADFVDLCIVEIFAAAGSFCLKIVFSACSRVGGHIQIAEMLGLRRSGLALMALTSAASIANCTAFLSSMGASSLAVRPGAFVSRQPVVLAGRSQSRSGASSLSMKIFDWQRRDALAKDPSLGGWTEEDGLGTLTYAPGSRQRRDRKGRGIAAGQGHQCGFGMRGQKSRSGRPTR